MHWSKEEINYLITEYPKRIHVDIISKNLKKSRRAVQHKAARLGLSRPYTPHNKPKNPQHRNITDKKYYEKHKKEIHKKRRIRFRALKLELIKILGGKCIKCGYNKCPAVLEFHHKGIGKDRNLASIIESSKQKA